MLLAITTKKLSDYQVEQVTELAADNGELKTLEALRKTIEKLELE